MVRFFNMVRFLWSVNEQINGVPLYHHQEWRESRQDWKERREREEGGQQGKTLHTFIPSVSELNTHHSTLNSFMPITLGRGSKDSFTIRGWQLWLKHCISTSYALYFRSVFIVSSCVLKEFIRTRGTLQPYLTFNRCGVQCNKRKNKCYMMPKRKSVSVMYVAIFLYYFPLLGRSIAWWT